MKNGKGTGEDGPNSLLLLDFQFLFKHIDVVSKAMIIDLDAHQVTIIFFVKQSNTVVNVVTS